MRIRIWRRFNVEYYTKGALLSASTKEALGQESGKCLKRRIHESDAQVKNNAEVILARPASDPFLAGHDLTPVGFSSPLDPT